MEEQYEAVINDDEDTLIDDLIEIIIVSKHDEWRFKPNKEMKIVLRLTK